MRLWRAWVSLFEPDAPDEPRFEPAHLAAVLVGAQVAAGGLFWLLWTLLVYEGGLPAKLGPALSVLAGRARLADYGWTGAPDQQGVFEGWLANLAALLLAALLLAALHRLDRRR